MTTPLALDLKDLRPADAVLKLSTFPEREFHLKKFTLNDRIWCHQKWGVARVQQIFETQSIAEMGELTYRLLREKDQFPTMESFYEAFVTLDDQVALITALLACIGISEHMFQKLVKDSETQEGNAESSNLAPSIGA